MWSSTDQPHRHLWHRIQKQSKNIKENTATGKSFPTLSCTLFMFISEWSVIVVKLRKFCCELQGRPLENMSIHCYFSPSKNGSLTLCNRWFHSNFKNCMTNGAVSHRVMVYSQTELLGVREFWHSQTCWLMCYWSWRDNADWTIAKAGNSGSKLELEFSVTLWPHCLSWKSTNIFVSIVYNSTKWECHQSSQSNFRLCPSPPPEQTWSSHGHSQWFQPLIFKPGFSLICSV